MSSRPAVDARGRILAPEALPDLLKDESVRGAVAALAYILARHPDPLKQQQPLAYSIKEFCQLHRISQATYFDLKNRGLGPVEMHVGRRRFVSAEAAAEWRRQREQDTAASTHTNTVSSRETARRESDAGSEAAGGRA
jgi:hypothetical protein